MGYRAFKEFMEHSPYILDLIGINSQIRFIPESGKSYVIRATSAYVDETGSYQLRIQ